MNKVFHLPSLFVYLMAAVLLVTSIYHGAIFLRQSFYAVLGLTEVDALRHIFGTDSVTFTPEAESLLREYVFERQRQADRSRILRSFLFLALSLSFFAWFWSRTARSHTFEMPFSVRNFYFFLVSIISFFIFFFAASQGITTAVNHALFPESNFYFDYHGIFIPSSIPDPKPPPRVVNLAELEAALVRQREEHAQQTVPWQTRSMVDQFAVAAVSLPVFYFHNRKFSF